MKSIVITVVCVVLVGELAQAARLSSQDWMLFKRQHGKNYETEAEDARRFAIFMATKQRVERHNAKADSSFKMGLSHLSDWTQEERATMKGAKEEASLLIRAYEKSNETEAYLAEILGNSSEPVSDEFDWRQVPGRVSPVTDQGRCASGWAFAACGALEGQEVVRVFNKTSQFVQLSAQQLIDCSEADNGCYQGSAMRAFGHLPVVGGIMSSRDYPYAGRRLKCIFNKNRVIMNDIGTFALDSDEAKLKLVLAKFGPIAVSIQTTENLMNYKSGVLIDDECPGEWHMVDHELLLVGYGTDPVHGDYWIVKNSWGSDWGENGYFRIKRGVDMCGIALYPIIPRF